MAKQRTKTKPGPARRDNSKDPILNRGEIVALVLFAVFYIWGLIDKGII